MQAVAATVAALITWGVSVPAAAAVVLAAVCVVATLRTTLQPSAPVASMAAPTSA